MSIFTFMKIICGIKHKTVHYGFYATDQQEDKKLS